MLQINLGREQEAFDGKRESSILPSIENVANLRKTATSDQQGLPTTPNTVTS